MKELSIEVTIDENGGVSAETFGFKGAVCEQQLKELLRDFVIEETEKKDDYYKQDEEILREFDSIKRGRK